MRAGRPLRVALVTPRLVKNDGQGRVNYEIVRSLLEGGMEVTAVAREVMPELRAYQNFRAEEIPVRLPSDLAKTQLFAYRSGRWIEANRSSFDIVHVNGSVTLAPSDVNSVHFVHDAWLKSPVHTARVKRNALAPYYWGATSVHRFEERIAFARSRCIVPVSERVREELIESGVPAGKLRVIVNGVDTDEFRPGAASREQLGLPDGVFLGLFAGDMTTPRKNLDTVLRALVRVPDVHLAVVGSLRLNPYPQMARQLGIADRVHFLGFRRDVPEIMRSVDAFVFPSRYEACSLVILEALASGLPVITARSAGGAELVDPSSGIVLPDANDVEGLARAIGFVSADPQRRRAMSAAARTIANAHTWRTMAQTYAQLYDELAREPLPKIA